MRLSMARTIVSFVAPTRGGDATARNRARGCRRPRAAEVFFRAGEGEVAGGEIRGILQFESIKSMVSWGLSPNEAGWGRNFF